MLLYRIPGTVVDACRKAGLTDDEIKALSARELFAKYCEWHGLIGWSSTLWETVMDLYKSEVA